MIKLYCFSGSGRTLAAADFFAAELKADVTEITREMPDQNEKNQISVVMFPVYCQNIPPVVADFLKKLETKYLVLVATYGGISHGNVLAEAKALNGGEVIAGVYLPVGHTFLNEPVDFDCDVLSNMSERIKNPRPAVIPMGRKNPFADFAPQWRSRVGVKIKRTENCNFCGVCNDRCPVNAIGYGIIKGDCMRCLRCVNSCPQNALEFKLHPVLKIYLSQKKKIQPDIFL